MLLVVFIVDGGSGGVGVCRSMDDGFFCTCCFGASTNDLGGFFGGGPVGNGCRRTAFNVSVKPDSCRSWFVSISQRFKKLSSFSAKSDVDGMTVTGDGDDLAIDVAAAAAAAAAVVVA